MNLPVPPYKECIHPLCGVLVVDVMSFKIVNNKVVEGWVMEASMLQRPHPCSVKTENDLQEEKCYKLTLRMTQNSTYLGRNICD